MVRYLAHAVMHGGKVYRQSIVELDGERVTVSRFDGEIHSTVFVSGIIVVAPQERVTTVNVDQMKRILGRAELIEEAIKRISRYVSMRNLAVGDGEKPTLVILQR
ncbi:MAG: hypothetical protein K2G47_11300 [Muribaculum sp.]|nr:hypothetical protein [Muribaculum sp.]